MSLKDVLKCPFCNNEGDSFVSEKITIVDVDVLFKHCNGCELTFVDYDKLKEAIESLNNRLSDLESEKEDLESEVGNLKQTIDQLSERIDLNEEPSYEPSFN